MELLGGCATAGHPRDSLLSGMGLYSRPSSFRYGSGPRQPAITAVSSSQEVLAPFLACASPSEFIELQRGVDMARLVTGLDDWSAVRLGALGPLRAGADILNRKRAAFLVTATREYGAARAEIFALFLVHSAFDDDLREVLGLLAGDKHLGETLGRMGAIREALRQRGLNLSDHEDRPERLSDVARGLASAANEALSTSELRRGALAMKYSAQRGQLPPPYQQALDEVERAEMEAAFSPGSVALGSFDTLTFGVPVGFYNLAAGTSHGAYSLSRGWYEQATRELAPAALLVALYAGGKGVRYLSEARGTTGVEWERGRLQGPEPHLKGLKEVVERLRERLDLDGIGALARYIQTSREAALFVGAGGEPAAVALYEARGNVAKAQAWFAEATSERTSPAASRAGAGSTLKGVASLVDETAGHTREVVETRLIQAELESPGPRLPGVVALLKEQHPSLSAPPPGVPEGAGLWREYVAYREKRLIELEQGKAAEGPLRWEAYEQMRGLFARGLAFERAMVSLLRADAALPQAQRRFLKDFNSPRIETSVGVTKAGKPGVRYADVLLIEEQPPPGQSPRVEILSFKSRDFRTLPVEPLTAQMVADASEALRYYGETLDIRRPTLKLRGKPVPVQRLRLVYDGKLKPENINTMRDAVRRAEKAVRGVEVLFE